MIMLWKRTRGFATADPTIISNDPSASRSEVGPVQFASPWPSELLMGWNVIEVVPWVYLNKNPDEVAGHNQPPCHTSLSLSFLVSHLATGEVCAILAR